MRKGSHHSEISKQKISLGHVGISHLHTDETKNKISKSNTGRIPGMLGKRHSDETKLKMKKSHPGKGGWNKGLKTPESVKTKISIANRKYVFKNKKDRKLHYTYGIRIEEYNEMLSKQNGVCALCGNENSVNKEMNVDHNHTTGKIRGLLCHNCNIGLGAFGDNIDKLFLAIKYLREYD